MCRDKLVVLNFRLFYITQYVYLKKKILRERLIKTPAHIVSSFFSTTQMFDHYQYVRCFLIVLSYLTEKEKKGGGEIHKSANT